MIRVENKRVYKGQGIYVGRPSLLGNPYVVGLHGDRNEVIKKYRALLWRRIKERGAVYRELLRLKEMAEKGELVLICWCAPQDCHAMTIQAAVEWLIAEGIEEKQKYGTSH